jgi:hypothetical protein
MGASDTVRLADESAPTEQGFRHKENPANRRDFFWFLPHPANEAGSVGADSSANEGSEAEGLTSPHISCLFTSNPAFL